MREKTNKKDRKYINDLFLQTDQQRKTNDWKQEYLSQSSEVVLLILFLFV